MPGMPRGFVTVSLSVMALASCCPPAPRGSTAPASGDPVAAVLPVPPPVALPLRHDPHSASEPTRVSTTHLALALAVDFEHHALAGTARITLARHDPGAPVILDTEQLAIASVTDCTSHAPLPFTLAPAKPVLGAALTVTLEASTCIEIAYRTSPAASALLWVEPEGTAGKRAPMLFTQSEAIHGRSWIPMQDTPGIRFTYDAAITVPVGLRALMSATNPATVAADGAWHFTMEQPIPSYLMALAVGDYAFQSIGPHTGVYAEPSVVASAAYEFAEVDAMVAAAERLYGPYRWGRYDMLVLPPSFPFGGMENPRLTFLTPTVITGDRALVSLIAHELAHSWSGNLVTNSTWSDSWLNEGFTTYVERRIMEELRGAEENEVEWYLSGQDLDAQLRTHPDDPDSVLALDAKATDDPEDIGGYVYDKGSLFLRALERGFGRAAFDAFLRERFDRHAFQSSDTATFEREITAALYAHPPAPAVRPLPDLHVWLHEPGISPAAIPAAPPRVLAIQARAAALLAAGTTVETTGWTTIDWMMFLRALPVQLPPDRIRAFDAVHHLTASTNPEIGMLWLPLLVRSDIRAATPAVRAYLLTIGRRRLVVPLYQALMSNGEYWRGVARAAFTSAGPLYHPITRDAIAKLVLQ